MYPTPKILLNISYYHLHRKVIEELKSKSVKEINWFNIVLIELRQKQNSMMYHQYYGKLLDYPTYKGEMYCYKYVLPSYRGVKWYFKKEGAIKNNYQFCESDIMDYIKHPIVSYIVKTCIKEKYDWDYNYRYQTIHKIKEILTQHIGYSKETSKYFDYTYQEQVYKTLNEKYNNINDIHPSIKDYLIKIKCKVGSMDLTKTQRHYFNPLNLKFWDKTTLKTSNKGLKADTTYSWTEEWGRGGWKFGGITADELEHICIINGFKKEKKKKYQYGDYANWYLHNLE